MPLPSADDFVDCLAKTFRPFADAQRAQGAGAYMRNLFPFVGIATPQRRACVRAAALAVPPTNLRAVCAALYKQEEREYHYAAWDVACLPSMRRLLVADDVKWLEGFITRHSWWDTVDYLVPKVIGPILRKERRALVEVSNRWISDDSI